MSQDTRTLRSLRSAAVMPDQSSRMRALAGRVAIQARRQAGGSVRFPDNGTYTVYAQGAVYVQKNQAALPPAPTAPGAPTTVVATRGNQQASVSFAAPADNGGVPIIDYTVYSNPGDATATVSSSPIIVTGLTNGTAYTFRVKARNSIGFSPLSAPSEPVVPATLPDPPTDISASPADRSIIVSFTPPVNTGGYPINNYTATAYLQSDDSLISSIVGFNSPITISSLVPPFITNGLAYYAKVAANTVIGSTESFASNIVVPATTPAAPSDLVATPGDASVSITFTAGDNGGSAITNYKYSLNGGAYTAFSPADTTSPVVISGLANGTTYAIRLKAVNSVGDGVASAQVSATPVSPLRAPDAPTGLFGQNITSTSVEITFTAGSNGGSAITNYKYSTDDGASFTSFSPTDTTSPVTITGLSASTTYSIKLRAVNTIGDGAISTSLSVTTASSNLPSGDSRMIILGDSSVNNFKSNINTAKSLLGYGGTLTIDTQQLNVSPSYTGSDLSGYDVVIILTNGGLSLNATLGDNLDAFVVSGRHLIMTSFCWGNVSAISNFDYTNNSVWAYKGSFSTVSMGTYTLVGTHPITTNISTSTGLGSQNIPNPITLTAEATTIATYSDGTSAIAVKTNGSSKLVGFNAYHPNISSANFYKYVVNAIYWVRGYLT